MPDASSAVTCLLAIALLLLGPIARAALRERLHPAVVFPVHWGIVLILILAAGPLGLYSVQPLAAALFVFGAVVFIGGSKAGDHLALVTTVGRSFNPWEHLNYRRLMALCAVLHLIMLPMWWQEITTIAGETSDLLVIGFQVRYKTVLGEEAVGPLVGNYLVLGFVIVPILVVGAYRGFASGLAVFAIAAPWVMANLITNGRSALVQLIVALAYIIFTERKPVDARVILTGLGITFSIIGGGVLLVAKGNTSAEDPIGDIALAVLTNISDYLLQGPILFSRYFTDEIRITPTWDALVFPCTLLQYAGLCKVGAQHQDFSDFGQFDQIGNIYSVYFSIFPKYGLLGVVLILGGYGAWAAFHHRRHKSGQSIVHTLIAAYLFAAIPLSIFADYFAPNLNFLIKTAIIAALLQRFVSKRPTTRPTHAAIQLRGHA